MKPTKSWVNYDKFLGAKVSLVFLVILNPLSRYPKHHMDDKGDCFMIFLWLSYDFVSVNIYIYIYIYIYAQSMLHWWVYSIHSISVDLFDCYQLFFFFLLSLLATMVPWIGSKKPVMYQIMDFSSILYLKTT